MKQAVKPPLGIMPRETWVNLRILDIIVAMERYSVEEKPIPVHWIHELKRHLWDPIASPDPEGPLA